MVHLNTTLSFLFYTLLPLLLTALFVWGFADALSRPARQFALATNSKNFWLAFLGVGGLVYFGVRVMHFYFPAAGLVTFVLIIGAVYYLGPERSKMGPRHGRGSGGRSRGTW